MRIAMVAEPYVAVPPLKYGGTERVIFYLVKGLLEKGHEVILLATADSKIKDILVDSNTPNAKSNLTILPICEKHTFFGKNTQEQKKILKKVDQIHLKTSKMLESILPKVDIIHSHNFDLINFQDFPNITTLHGPFIMSNLSYFEKRKGLFYVSISENQQEGFPDLQYVGVCYNGLDPEEFPYVAKPDNYVSFIGRFDSEKNPHLAIELALRLGIKIKIAGKLDWLGKEYFDEKIKPHLENPLVEYLGELDMPRKVELISHSQVNLHPTGFREPFGLTVLESAYCGTPTMAISQGSMPELIEDGRTGLLVEDYVEGYHHIDEILAMDRKYISERARNLFNYKTMARQYELAYEKVIEIFFERRHLSAKTLKEMQNMRDILKGVWKQS